MFDHNDSLHGLNNSASVNDKLAVVHRTIQSQFPFINRISVAPYDGKSDMVKTYASSDHGPVPLAFYHARLADCPSLQEIIQVGKPRVINDLAIFSNSQKNHTDKIRAEGYVASYTMPIYHNGALCGFTFFNSTQKDVFDAHTLQTLDIFGHLISSIVTTEMVTSRVLLAALKTSSDMIHYKDPETGAHLDRVARFSRLIALTLAREKGYALNDEFIESVFLFAPLHDVGKISIPDKILLKPGKLDEEEFDIMKSHSTKGREIIDLMISNFGLDALMNVKILQNIAESHHETMDGSGYPNGLTREEIPVEARIISVADVFDALTSDRPYKDRWSNQKAFDYLLTHVDSQFDPDCVYALVNAGAEIEEIQAHFIDAESDDAHENERRAPHTIN